MRRGGASWLVGAALAAACARTGTEVSERALGRTAGSADLADGGEDVRDATREATLPDIPPETIEPQVLQTFAGLAMGMTTDATGNLYVVGSFEGSADFGAGIITSRGRSDAFLLKLTPTGTVLWSKVFGTPGAEGFAAVACDPTTGVVTVSGSAEGQLDLGLGPLPPPVEPWFSSVGDGFIARFNADGTIRSSARTPRGRVDRLAQVGAVVAMGGLNPRAVGGPDLPLSAFTSRLGATATLDLATNQGLIDDMSGNPRGYAVVGNFAPSLGTPDAVVATADRGATTFVSRLGPAGGHLWTRAFLAQTESVAIASDDAVFIGGRCVACNVPGAPPDAAFVTKLTPTGVVQWTGAFKSTGGNHEVTSMSALPSGGVAYAGYFSGIATFDDRPHRSDEIDAYVAVTDAAGRTRWSAALARAGSSLGPIVVADPTGAVYVASTFGLGSAQRARFDIAKFAP